MNIEKMLTVTKKHSLQAFLHVMRVAVNCRKWQKLLKKCSTAKDYLDQTNYLPRSVR